jgi:hypothetical protein
VSAVAQLVSAGQLNFPLAGRCCRCEHPYALNLTTPATTTSGGSNVQGAVSLAVASGSSFSTPGMLIVVDSSSVDGGAECLTVSSAGSAGAIPIAGTPLRLTHAAGRRCRPPRSGRSAR